MKKLSFFFATAFLALLFSQNTTAQNLPDYLPAEGLVAWWPFNGNANDESGNGNNGTVNGATLTTDRFGNSNSAYDFDGVNDYISGNSSGSLNVVNTQQLSMSCWINVENFPPLLPNDSFSPSRIFTLSDEEVDITNQQYALMGTGNGGIYWLAHGPSGFESNGSNATDTDNPLYSTGTWEYLTMTYDGDTIKLYHNASLVFARQQSDSFISGPTEYFTISSTTYNPVTSFNGKIDDIAIYNRALTPEEITALYTGIPYIAPCADPTACNFEQEGECVYAEPNLDCAGNCLNDCNNNGVCDENEVLGCTYTFACNYNPAATTDDGTCTVAQPNYDCDGNCLNDDNQNGVCDDQEVYGCTYADAINYDEAATSDDGSCLYTCKGDFDNNGLVDSNDLLSFLAAFGYSCSDAGCDDEAACNYDPEALYSDGSCTYPEEFFNCEGVAVNDADGDGVPDELEVAGCTDPEAVNYTPEATDDDGSCAFGIVGDAHTCGAENVHNPDLVYGEVTDIDGNTYRTIVIGEQEWMAENLTVVHYANGDPIPQVTGTAEWASLSTGAWCYYDNDPAYKCPYGKLYNWYVTIDERNVCPTGWHVPSDAEWTVLSDYLGGAGFAGGQMKTTGTQYWDSPNGGATNESGFSGLPGGYRNLSGNFFSYGVGDGVGWWSSSENFANYAWYRYLDTSYAEVSRSYAYKTYGFSCRCVRD